MAPPSSPIKKPNTKRFGAFTLRRNAKDVTSIVQAFEEDVTTTSSVAKEDVEVDLMTTSSVAKEDAELAVEVNDDSEERKKSVGDDEERKKWLDEQWAREMADCKARGKAFEAALAAAAEKKKRPSFSVGQSVFVARSDGTETLAFVCAFDTESKLYEVDLETSGSGLKKRVATVHMRAAPQPQGIALGSRVLVTRSSGDTGLAFVREYDGTNGLYTLECDHKGSGLAKKVYETMIKPAPLDMAPIA